MDSTKSAPRLWLDVEDLFVYAGENARPSGIQRLAFEMYQNLQTRFGASGLVQFVRHDPVRHSFRTVPWSEVRDLYAGMTRLQPAATAARAAITQLMAPIAPHSQQRQFVRRLVYRLDPALRKAISKAARSQIAALRDSAAALKLLASSAVRRPAPARPAIAPSDIQPDAPFVGTVRPGDILLILGSPWSHPDYGALLRHQREKHQLRVALLVYDLIPLRRPEWCDANLVRLFRTWFEGTYPQCDALFAISHATAGDVERTVRARGDQLPVPVRTIPIGTGFSDPPAADTPAAADLPAPGSYALIVSTIEARKNHLLLFRVWRQLLEDLPRDQVPSLVFAGRIGWLVDDLIQMIANTSMLDGKLVLIESPSDAELRTLYAGCLFTLFPSFYEGWGLPVTESLAMGKPCLIADRTSLPEAGGDLARKFDPDNLHDAYNAIRDTILDRDGLREWEATVKATFKPVGWSETVDGLLEGLKHPLANDKEAVPF